MTHPIRVGVGGWTYEPWRGVFYPDKLSQKKELTHMAGRLSSIEINGTYYSSFKPDTWMKWRDETPDDFVFAVKASRFTTNRKVLVDGAGSMEIFLNQGLTLLGPKLGPINWQFMATKKFDPADFEGFLKLFQLHLRVAEWGLPHYRFCPCPRPPLSTPVFRAPNRLTATA
ncbi:MAG TPA: DUF72 domain-containing protein [Brevundimonas sp.]|uniref:DUF72 domain-containing protein n=1 Tax=Brevundimonas sp. TaxID=1871086 RepID=UPI002BF5EE3D|nr:DUF72 domain-containing protein [Brevundimonas sp.]HRH19119.1 DUF72 domain-containing protein [Brevundimonas sp.]